MIQFSEMFFKVETTNYYIYIYMETVSFLGPYGPFSLSLLVSLVADIPTGKFAPQKNATKVLSQMLAGGGGPGGGSCWLLLENVAL